MRTVKNAATPLTSFFAVLSATSLFRSAAESTVTVKRYGTFKDNNILFYHDFHRRRCVEPSLEARESQADVIFTGTVRDLVPIDGDQRRARVEVKRVMNGTRRLVVDVSGIGKPSICNSHARINDTRIFLVAKTPVGELSLNSSLVRISLTNIEQAEAAVNGEFVR